VNSATAPDSEVEVVAKLIFKIKKKVMHPTNFKLLSHIKINSINNCHYFKFLNFFLEQLL